MEEAVTQKLVQRANGIGSESPEPSDQASATTQADREESENVVSVPPNLAVSDL